MALQGIFPAILHQKEGAEGEKVAFRANLLLLFFLTAGIIVAEIFCI